jgi:SAM-dependent methyltransferase
MPEVKARSLRSQMLNYFGERAEAYDAEDIRRMGWTSRASQDARFDVMYGIDDLRDKSLLDVGCGVGDFYGYLKRRGFRGSYAGLDLISENCRAAAEKYGEELFLNRDVLDLGGEEKYDYVFASGIFFLPADDWEEAVSRTLARMFALCRLGIAANFLSLHSPNQVPAAFYADPATVIKLCLPLTHNFAIKHDNDFTLFALR